MTRISNIGIVTFFKEASNFSESFKMQFSKQLEYAFNYMTEIEDFAKKRGFFIHLGMTEMRTMCKDGYGFAVLDICTPLNRSVSQTFFWKTEDPEDAFFRDGWDHTNIQFGFCADFQRERFQQFKKRKVVRVIRKERLQFKYIEEIALYPDLWLTLEFTNSPKKDTIDLIHKELCQCLDESYVGDPEMKERQLSFMIDFQGTEFNTGRRQLRDFILFLNNSLQKNNSLTSVCIA